MRSHLSFDINHLCHIFIHVNNWAVGFRFVISQLTELLFVPHFTGQIFNWLTENKMNISSNIYKQKMIINKLWCKNCNMKCKYCFYFHRRSFVDAFNMFFEMSRNYNNSNELRGIHEISLDLLFLFTFDIKSLILSLDEWI